MPNLQSLDAYRRQTIGDAEGRFGFEGVVPGKYIVSAVISWEAPDSEGALAPQLVSVVGFAEVREGMTTKVLVTDWVAQRTGVGRLGEMKIPPMDPDAEAMGQRLLRDEDEAR